MTMEDTSGEEQFVIDAAELDAEQTRIRKEEGTHETSHCLTANAHSNSCKSTA